MRMSVVPLIFFDDIAIRRTRTLGEVAGIVRELGAEGIEAYYKYFDDLKPETLDAQRRAANDQGIEFSSFCSGPDFSHPDPEARKREVEGFKRHIDAAAYLGCPVIRMTAGQGHPGVSIDDAVEWVVEGFTECVEYAEGTGVICAYEDHYKDYYWDYPDVSFDPDVFLRIVDRMRGTSMRVNFDSSNPVMAERDPVPILQAVKDLVVNVHLSDRITAGRYEHADVGDGVVDFNAIFAILREIGYDGWIAVEYNGLNGIPGLRKSLAFASGLIHAG
ncbi:MAG: sugar phosphate isomerase/epimerase family protein [Armatimonadota bacterium]|jgi:sugar phosphate isomerase/epimerase|nr:sugar phosphate isomerase/epimerase family protein [Acidobacteriota bacterium]NLN90092.1 TIM barrel protein [candidate division WS1 bacterium]